jgi:hypothetical protein
MKVAVDRGSQWYVHSNHLDYCDEIIYVVVLPTVLLLRFRMLRLPPKCRNRQKLYLLTGAPTFLVCKTLEAIILILQFCTFMQFCVTIRCYSVGYSVTVMQHSNVFPGSYRSVKSWCTIAPDSSRQTILTPLPEVLVRCVLNKHKHCELCASFTAVFTVIF